MDALNVALFLVGGLTVALSLVAGLIRNRVFFLFGVVLPVEEWLALGPDGVVLVAGILLLRRLPVVVVFERFVDSVEGRRDALFAGWFGPIGIAALFYATVAHRLLGLEVVWSAVSLVVAGSILVHGVTATPFTKRYGQRADADGETGGEDEGSTFEAV